MILYSISPPVSLRTSQRSSAICPGEKSAPRKKKKVVAVGLERNLECCVANVCSCSDTLARLSLTSVTAAPPQRLCVSSASSAPFFPLFFKSPRCCIHIPLFLPPVFSHCSHSSVCVSLPPPPPSRTTFVRLCLSAVFF